MDLISLVKDQITSAALQKISGVLGESTETTQTALGGAIPAIVGGLIQKSSTTEGAGGIMDMIKGAAFGDNVLDAVGTDAVTNAGGSILNSLFGDKIGGIASWLANYAGMKSGSASSLLSMAAPLVMGVLGKQVSSQGLGISGLVNLLMGQKDSVKAALPAGLGSMLNLGSLGDLGRSTVGATTAAASSTMRSAERATEEAVEDARGGLGKWWPWLLLAGLLLLGLFMWKGCKDEAATAVAEADTAAASVATAVDSAASNMATAVDSAANKVASSIKRKLSTGVELNFGNESIENELISFIEDKTKPVDKTTWFNFRNLRFKTGSAQIDDASMEEVKNIAEIMKAFPDVNIKVGGYTDNVGKAASNLKLSADRAANVMKALTGMGIAKGRMESEGYGQEHPVASNDTEEGRAQNRRIAVRVTKK